MSAPSVTILSVTITTDSRNTTVSCADCAETVPAFWTLLNDEDVLVVEPHTTAVGPCPGSHQIL